jgi:hypothetical protein
MTNCCCRRALDTRGAQPVPAWPQRVGQGRMVRGNAWCVRTHGMRECMVCANAWCVGTHGVCECMVRGNAWCVRMACQHHASTQQHAPNHHPPTNMHPSHLIRAGVASVTSTSQPGRPPRWPPTPRSTFSRWRAAARGRAPLPRRRCVGTAPLG